MKRGRLPLTALRSFEAAGRLRSFIGAARELSLSHAVISRQVRELEQRVQTPLLIRTRRPVELTDAGRRLLQVLTGSFDDIAGTLDALLTDRRSVVTIASEPTFAACWLEDQLTGFRQDHPELDVRLLLDRGVPKPGHGRFDLAIRYSATASLAGVEALHLLDVDVVPVAAPALLAAAEIKSTDDLAKVVLLHEQSRPLWRAWLDRESAAVVPTRGVVFADGNAVIHAALQGRGVALMDALFVEKAITSGQLVPLFGASGANTGPSLPPGTASPRKCGCR